jgi:enoyl-CoA hydratase/carnithine racemase
MENAFHFEMLENNIGKLTFDLPGEKVNKFNTPVMQELDILIDDLVKNPDLKCLLIMTGKKGIFIAGADIKEIVTITDLDEGVSVSKQGHRVFDKLAALPFPTIAVIDGAYMGQKSPNRKSISDSFLVGEVPNAYHD